MQLGEEEVVGRLIWQKGPIEVWAACDEEGPFLEVYTVAETEDMFIYTSYPNYPFTGEIAHYVGTVPKGDYDAGLLWFGDLLDSMVLNQAGVGAITAIGVDSGKTYYIGLEGESFIGYGDDGTCFLSGVLHVYG